MSGDTATAYNMGSLTSSGPCSWEDIWKVVQAVDLPNFGIRTLIPAKSETPADKPSLSV